MSARSETKRQLRRNRFFTAIFFATWVALLGLGFGQLYAYSHTPGATATARPIWPDQDLISRNSLGATLLVFVHPNCPCSVATVSELERLVTHTTGKIETHVLFYKPKSKSETWAKELLWNRVAAIPGVSPLLDEDGRQAELFGAKTSGQVFLYDSNGGLVFQGGITPERGHMGDSVGRDSILTFVKSGHAPTRSSFVFGCSIRNPERSIAVKGSSE